MFLLHLGDAARHNFRMSTETVEFILGFFLNCVSPAALRVYDELAKEEIELRRVEEFEYNVINLLPKL